MNTIEKNKEQELLPEENAKLRPFFNPICQETYKALPKIYGNYKRKINLIKKPQLPPTKHCCIFQQHKTRILHKSCSKGHMQYYKRLSEPKIHKCIKKYCFCNSLNSIDNSCREGKTSRLSNINVKKIKLPQLRLQRQGILDDIQSKHKVLRTQPNPQIGSFYIASGLGQLVSINAKMNAAKANDDLCCDQQADNPEDAQNQQNLFENGFSSTSSKNAIFNKNRNPTSSLSQNQEDKILTAKSPLQHNRRNKFKQQVDQSQAQSKQSQAISVSSSTFRLNKRQSTMFNQFNNKQSAILKRSRAKSTLSNGLFKIPQENQYDTYIQDYKPIDANFNLKKLVTSQNFKVIRLPKGVYFGQIDDNIKNGQGVLVTQKEVYQGKFQNNIKVKGCERNIDGVFIGEFVNGQRSGQGIFRWNNGEIFQGQWKQGTKNGHGIWTSPKGDYYDGEWAMNRQQGIGTFKHKNSTYKGSFHNFLKHGHGEERFANGDYYIGEYSEGKPHGKGRYQWSQGGYYQGTFVRGFREGAGKWIQSSGDIYEGEFYRDFKQGKGKEIYKNGQIFVGQFKQGVQYKGKLYDVDGKIISVAE